MFANRTAINRDTALGGNAPFQPQQIVINGSADTPGGAIPRQFPFTMTIQDPVFKIPTAWNWNTTFQRELPGKTTIEVAYVAGGAFITSGNATSTNCCREPSRPIPASTPTLCARMSGWAFWDWPRTPAGRCTTACRSAPNGGSRRVPVRHRLHSIASPRRRLLADRHSFRTRTATRATTASPISTARTC